MAPGMWTLALGAAVASSAPVHVPLHRRPKSARQLQAMQARLDALLHLQATQEAVSYTHLTLPTICSV
eukprot:5551846-Alexandrium_andersonii.AAC.1